MGHLLLSHIAQAKHEIHDSPQYRGTDWTSVFASERLTGALLDRLTHHVHILEMNGDSYRLAQSKRRSRQAKVEPAVADQPPPSAPA
jgi:hypothetical protein